MAFACSDRGLVHVLGLRGFYFCLCVDDRHDWRIFFLEPFKVVNPVGVNRMSLRKKKYFKNN